MANTMKAKKTTSGEKVVKTDRAAGYKQPPVASQFLPGVSGNPGGRPLGAKNKLPAIGLEHVRSAILAELRDQITVSVGETTITVPVLYAILRKMTDKATSGDMRAAHIFLTMVQEIEARDREFYERFSARAIVYLRAWEEELHLNKFRDRQIYPGFPFNHLSVNRATGRVEIHDPIPFEPPESISIDTETGRAVPVTEGWNLTEIEDPIAIARWFMAIMVLPEGKRFED